MKIKPGETVPDSGILVEKGPRGGAVDGGRRVVIEQSEHAPPTSEAGNHWVYQRNSRTTNNS